MSDMPYVKLTLFADLAADDENGWTHMPMAIESWPPGMNVKLLLRRALESLEREEEA